jgi:hypothetical protein
MPVRIEPASPGCCLLSLLLLPFNILFLPFQIFVSPSRRFTRRRWM